MYASVAFVGNDIFGGIVLPTYILLKLRKTMPEFYMRNTPEPRTSSEFFVFSQSYHPRDREEPQEQGKIS